MTSGMMWLVTEQILNNVPAVVESFDARLKNKSPSTLIVTTAVATLALLIFARYLQRGWGQTWRDQIGNLALRIPYIQKKYAEDMQKQQAHFRESVAKKWAAFGELQTTLPERGWSYADLVRLIQRYSQITSDKIRDKHFSGTIYSNSLVRSPDRYEDIEELEMCCPDEPRYFELLSKKLEKAFQISFKEAHLWNSLHADEFAIGACIDYQVVRIVADMFGGKVNEVMGFVTSGGTESLMVAIRAYRDWGMKHRGHEPGEGVIIASDMVHAAIQKAGKAYCVEVVLLESDENGRMDLEALKSAEKYYGDRLIAIIGSAPCYPTGVIDPIAEMAAIAKKNGCGMHVDCCLGGFIVNWNAERQYLTIPGVTSLSADTHKNGMAPKGSSVLVTKAMGDTNLAYYSIYSIPGWSGGAYGTPKDAGSQSCVQSLNALIALLGTGKDGYERLKHVVTFKTMGVASVIRQCEGKLKLIAPEEANVVAFKIDEKWGLGKGATYAFAHEMSKRNFVLNAINHDAVHFCVTVRFANDIDAIEKFSRAVNECLRSVDAMRWDKKFPGDAGMYCALEAALEPDSQELSKGKYLENWLLGRQGAHDAIRAYFLAQLDPFVTDLV